MVRENHRALSVSSSYSAAWAHRLCNIPTLDTPKVSTPHSTPSQGHTIALTISCQGGQPESLFTGFKIVWMKTATPLTLISGAKHENWCEGPRPGPGAKDGESLRHQELMTAFQWCSSAASCCFEAYLWLSGEPQGQQGQASSLWLPSKHHQGHVGELGNGRSEKCRFPRLCARGSQTPAWCWGTGQTPALSVKRLMSGFAIYSYASRDVIWLKFKWI